METTNDNDALPLLTGSASNTGQGQQGNCRVHHREWFTDNLRIAKEKGTFYRMFHCPLCFVDTRYEVNWATDEEYAKYFHQIEDQMDEQREQYSARYKKKHAGHQLGAKEFTLTYSPKWFEGEPDIDLAARQKMRKAIDKICRTYKTAIVELRAVGEVGKEGQSHIHCYYLLDNGGKITEKEFKRAYPYWDSKVKLSKTGHKGGHHADVKNEIDFKGYIEKEMDNAWIDIHVDNRDK